MRLPSIHVRELQHPSGMTILADSSTMTTSRPPDPIAQRPSTTNTNVHGRLEVRGLIIPSPDASASFLVELNSPDPREPFVSQLLSRSPRLLQFTDLN